MNRLTPTLFIVISLFGVILLIAMVYHPPKTDEVLLIRKPVVGSIFIIECLMGMLATIFPRRCSRIFRGDTMDTHDDSEVRALGREPVIRGHHPECTEFSHHIIRIGERTFCAGCSGLLLGALVTLIGALFYFFANIDFHMNYTTFLLGCIGITSGLLQLHLFNFERALLRAFFNMFFVIGTFLALISVDGLLQNIFVDLFLICLSFFWIYTRIVISRWNHDEICKECSSYDCGYKEVKD